MANIAARLRERRKVLKLNQEELAALLNITQSQISRYERGENEPSGEQLVALAHILNTSTDYLLGMTDDPNPPQSTDLVPRESQAINAWRRGDITEAIRIIVGG